MNWVEELSEKQNPKFSIIILFWNNGQYFQKCLDSLSNQIVNDFEIIIIDNGSQEPIIQELLQDFPNLQIELIQLPENIGFSAGNNLGVEHSRGKYIITLNADAFPEKEWLENIHKAIEKYPDCFFASKLIIANDPVKIDGAGDVYHFTGQVWRKYHNYEEKSLQLKEKEVFSACGAAAIYPKEAFLKVGGFDPDYFSYVEDIDLGFRLRLAGYNCIFLPDAVVHHVGSGSTGKKSDFSVYYGQRNLVWTFMKNMPGLLFWMLLPFHVILNILAIGLSLIRKQGKVTIKAKIDALNCLPGILSKRRNIQKNRQVSIFHIIQVVDWNFISPLKKLLLG
ncbi:MAG: glycosyltransferase family 2 protein [Chloroflexi bacterium HGW-Chloroflexi-2]|jgi:GT2 family glycosyltransferase|nr:MAG: glycosyltransferase family 2 protein [Chloroflexi bacterium HGW-Chloroflexi-2]